MRDKQVPPFLVHGQTVREEAELLFEESGSLVCFLRRKTIPVAVERASTRVPNSPRFCEV
jgi:hypothetical protein